MSWLLCCVCCEPKISLEELMSLSEKMNESLDSMKVSSVAYTGYLRNDILRLVTRIEILNGKFRAEREEGKHDSGVLREFKFDLETGKKNIDELFKRAFPKPTALDSPTQNPMNSPRSIEIAVEVKKEEKKDEKTVEKKEENKDEKYKYEIDETGSKPVLSNGNRTSDEAEAAAAAEAEAEVKVKNLQKTLSRPKSVVNGKGKLSRHYGIEITNGD